jgi:hypothetical protein
MVYPAHLSFLSQQLNGGHPNNFLSQPANFYFLAAYSPATLHFEPTSGLSQLPLLPEFPISNDESLSLPPVEEILKSVAKPASKVAGTHHLVKSKGKGKALDEYPTIIRGTKHKMLSGPVEEVVPKWAHAQTRGCQSGSFNYLKKDLDILMQVACGILPIGVQGWRLDIALMRWQKVLIDLSVHTSPSS